MYNGNSLREQKHVKAINKYNSASDIRKENKKKVVREYLAQRSTDRRNDWCEKVGKSAEFAKYFHHEYETKHPDLMDFRINDKDSAAFKKFNYLPSKQRALSMSKSHKELYFVEGERYNPSDFNKKPIFRDTNKLKTIQPVMKFK